LTWQQWSSGGVTTLSERKLGFHSKHTQLRCSKKHTQHTLLCSVAARSTYDSAWLCLQLSRTTVVLLPIPSLCSHRPLLSHCCCLHSSSTFQKKKRCGPTRMRGGPWKPICILYVGGPMRGGPARFATPNPTAGKDL